MSDRIREILSWDRSENLCEAIRKVVDAALYCAKRAGRDRVVMECWQSY